MDQHSRRSTDRSNVITMPRGGDMSATMTNTETAKVEPRYTVLQIKDAKGVQISEIPNWTQGIPQENTVIAAYVEDTARKFVILETLFVANRGTVQEPDEIRAYVEPYVD